MENNRQVKGIWIPIEIWECKDLSWNEKILLLEIDSYTTKEKDCYISNEYISNLLGVTETSANKILSSLIKKGYVVKTSFDGRRRYVKSALSFRARQGCSEEQGRVAPNGNIPKEDTNTINYKKEIDKSISKKDDFFEQCWKEYRRKGSKAEAKKQWAKITDVEKGKILAHIKAYVSSRELSYQQDFQRYLKNKTFNSLVVANNTVIYDPEKVDSGEYNPQCDGISLFWNDVVKCYITPFDITTLADGYTKDNRPNGAVVMWSGWRYIWDVEQKVWVKK